MNIFRSSWRRLILVLMADARRGHWSGIVILCAAAAAIFLASCVGSPAVPTPATHKMVGTNSPGW